MKPSVTWSAPAISAARRASRSRISRDLLRGVLEAAAVAERRVAHHDLVSLLDEPCERAAAEDLEIVRMRPDGEDPHQGLAASEAYLTRRDRGCPRADVIGNVWLVKRPLQGGDASASEKSTGRRFDHIGLVTDEVKDGESFVAATRVWVTNPRADALQHRVAALRARHAGDRAAAHRSRTSPTASTTSSAAIEGHKVLAEPFDPTGRGDDFLRVAFVEVDGAVVEFMQYGEPRRERVVLMEPKLRVEGATKVYAGKSGAVHALEDFSLDVAEGELVTILGPSGCGKTTLLWAMSGLHALTSGRITARRDGGRRAAAARDRDDLPGGEPAALAQPAPEHRVPVRDQEEAGRPGARRCAARARPG